MKWVIARLEDWEQIAEVPARGSFSDYQYIDSLVGLDKSSPYWYNVEIERKGVGVGIELYFSVGPYELVEVGKMEVHIRQKRGWNFI